MNAIPAPAAAETPYAILRGTARVPLAEIAPRRARVLSGKPKIALVVGTFAAVPYVHLQLEARRRLYPEVPLLVHDDHSPRAAELAALCGAYGANFVQTATRFPPCKGDLSAFVYGLGWAREMGADVLVKLSRRFIPKIRWVDGLAALVEAADYATYSAWTESFNFGFRTECLALAVKEWFDLGLVGQMNAAIHAEGVPFVEGFMHGLARQAAAVGSEAARVYDAREGARLGDRDGYAVWPFMGRDRCAWSADFLWHDAVGPGEYARLASQWGLPYAEADFGDENMGFGELPPVEAPLLPPKTEGISPPPQFRAVVYTVAHNEAVLLPFFVRHYAWAERIVVYDDASTDGTRAVLAQFPQVEVRPFDSGGVLDEGVLNGIKNHCWKECRGQGVDFVVVVDADEFVWVEDLPAKLLRWKAEGVNLVRPTGFDMIAGEPPAGDGLLTASVRRGKRNPDYDKPCIFQPDAFTEIIFTAGCHDCGPRGEIHELRTDEARLLHYRFLGEDFYVERMALRRARRSEANRQNGWGFHYERCAEELRTEFAALWREAQEVI